MLSAKRRRTQSERSASTRQQLFKITLDLLAKRGYASLRMAEIVEAAGLSKGALLHHFSTKHDLLIAAAASAMAEATKAELQHVTDVRAKDDPIAALIDAQRSFFFGTYSVVEWEMMVAARTDPELGKALREITAEYRLARDNAWRDLLVSRGLPPEKASLVIEMTVSLWRGFVLRYLRDRSRLRELGRRGDAVALAWLKMVAGYTVGDARRKVR